MKNYTIYVTEEIAKKAMEKGFECDIVTTAAFAEEPHCYNEFQIDRTLYKCPSAEQICGWLREEKNITINISKNCSGILPITYYYEIVMDITFKDRKFYNDYIKTLLEGINEALDLI